MGRYCYMICGYIGICVVMCVIGCYMWLQRVMDGYRGLQKVMDDYRGFRMVIQGYGQLQGVIEGYGGLQMVIYGYGGLQMVIEGYGWLYVVMQSYIGCYNLYRVMGDVYICNFGTLTIQICVDLKNSVQTWCIIMMGVELKIKLCDMTNYNTIKHHLHA